MIIKQRKKIESTKLYLQTRDPGHEIGITHENQIIFFYEAQSLINQILKDKNKIKK